MKRIILFYLFCFNYTLLASETVLFIDTNSNEIEISEAKAEAKRLGKKFISYPNQDESFDQSKAYELLKKTPFSTLIVSGHNGGGAISGDNGYISPSEIQTAVADNPFVKDNMQTLMLLGCNTSNPGKINTWRNIFPNLRILAGYDGTAPEQDKPAGISYIKEVLRHKDHLYRLADEKKLERAVRNFEHIYYLQAGLYINKINCRDEDTTETEYIFRPTLDDTSQRFTQLNLKECDARIQQFQEELYPRYLAYFDGELAHPTEESAEELRHIYNFLQQFEHCSEGSISRSMPDANTALMLRFWREAQHNISTYFKEELKALFDQVESLKKDNLESKKEELIKANNKKINFIENILNSDNPEQTLNQINQNYLNSLETNISKINKEVQNMDQKELDIGNKLIDIFGEKYTLFIQEIDELQAQNQPLTLDDIKALREKTLNIMRQKSYIDESTFNQLKKLSDDLYETRTNRQKLKLAKSAFDYLITTQSSSPMSINDLVLHKITTQNNILNIKMFKQESLNSLPIDNLADFRTATRAEISQFAHSLSSNPEMLPFLSSQSQRAVDIINNHSYQLWGMPFSWHEEQDNPEDIYHYYNISSYVDINQFDLDEETLTLIELNPYY
ncbi:MAG: hypothetical protein QF441_11485 [Bacteriovoracaceae bacterium]|jgi:hypothetical protein|nr:hypothetical protein [Bacteriovoracaceae bacterium]